MAVLAVGKRQHEACRVSPVLSNVTIPSLRVRCLEWGVPAELLEGGSDEGGSASFFAGCEVLVLAGFADAVAGLLSADAEFLGDVGEWVTYAVLAQGEVA